MKKIKLLVKMKKQNMRKYFFEFYITIINRRLQKVLMSQMIITVALLIQTFF